jgi:uncharacterized delta-60 repeat protein
MRYNVSSVSANRKWLPWAKASSYRYTKGFLLLALLASAALISPRPVKAQAGQLDPTFGTNGIFTTQFTTIGATIANAMTLQSDGKILAAGSVPSSSFESVGLLRLNTNGTLDTTFGTGGIVSNSFGVEFVQAYGIAVLPNGKIVVAAEGITGGSIGRFNSDGSVDTTFGVNGFAISNDNGVNAAGGAAVMAVLPDGKIIVTGDANMARYTADGELDTTFGTDGIASMVGLYATGIAVQPNGKMLITTGSSAPRTPPEVAPTLPFPSVGAIARYNPNGSLDASFGTLGQSACVTSVAGIAPTSDGKIVVAGIITSELMVGGNATGFGLVRYNSNGSIDASFGSHGGVITGFPPTAAGFALAVQTNDDIVVAGETAGGTPQNPTASLALARYTSAGALDPTFGTGGKVITTLGNNDYSWVAALALQTDGKIVAVGNNGITGGQFVDNFIVARYLGQ